MEGGGEGRGGGPLGKGKESCPTKQSGAISESALYFSDFSASFTLKKL